jgi:hypothetical protein
VVDLSDGADTTIWAQSSSQPVSRTTSDLAPDRGGRSGTTGLLQWVVDQLRQGQQYRRDDPCRSAELCRRQPQGRLRDSAAQQVAVTAVAWRPRPGAIYGRATGGLLDCITPAPALFAGLPRLRISTHRMHGGSPLGALHLTARHIGNERVGVTERPSERLQPVERSTDLDVHGLTSAVGADRAPAGRAWHGGGQRFESPKLHPLSFLVRIIWDPNCTASPAAPASWPPNSILGS